MRSWRPKNAIYAQSGVTSVINATAGGVIEAARKSKRINKLFAGKNGIGGLLREDIIETSIEDIIEIKKFQHTPGGIFDSCRHKLKDPSSSKKEYEGLIEVFKAHDIGVTFFTMAVEIHKIL